MYTLCMKLHFTTGTQHGRNKSDPKYYTTNSQIPQLPFVTGFVGTAGTYRFTVVSYQTALVVGEGISQSTILFSVLTLLLYQ